MTLALPLDDKGACNACASSRREGRPSLFFVLDLRHSSMDSFGVRSLGSAAAQGGQDTSTEAAHERVTLHRMGHGRPALQASRDASCQVEKSCRMTIRRRDPPNSHITTFFTIHSDLLSSSTVNHNYFFTVTAITRLWERKARPPLNQLALIPASMSE